MVCTPHAVRKMEHHVVHGDSHHPHLQTDIVGVGGVVAVVVVVVVADIDVVVGVVVVVVVKNAYVFSHGHHHEHPAFGDKRVAFDECCDLLMEQPQLAGC